MVIGGKETATVHEEVGNTIGKLAATGGTHAEPLSKKPKNTMTTEQETFVMVQIEVMKTEVITYQTLADSIKPLVERKDDKGQDNFDISDSVQNYQYSRTCCVHCSLTHPTVSHLRVSLASSIQLSMPIRIILTMTTCSYRYSHSFNTRAL